MAATGSLDVREHLNTLTECVICAGSYRDPRILPCVHTYCLKCIEGFCRDKNPGDEVECPLCRTKFHLPVSGVEGLQKNFLVEQLKDVEDAADEPLNCEGCCTEDDGSAVKKLATLFCVECGQRLCESCVEIHGRLRATRTHKLVKSNGGDEVSEINVKWARNYCDEHPDEALKWFCFDCKAAICVTCFVESHKMHECSDYGKVTDEFRKQIKSAAEDLRGGVLKSELSVEGQRTMKAELYRRISEIEREICDHAERITQQIEREKRSLLEEVEQCKNNEVKQIDHVIDGAKQRVSFMGSLVAYAEELADKGTAADVTQQAVSIQDRAVELLKLDSIPSGLGSMDISFTPATWLAPTNSNLVGRIDVKGTTQPSLVHVIPIDDTVDGLTSMNDEMFVMRHPHRQRIEVYSTLTFGLLRTLQIKHIGDRSWCQLTSCRTNNCLYVSHRDESTVYRVDLTAARQVQPVKWRAGSGPDGLSVNRQCNVVVSCYDADTIEEYTSSGSLVRRISLQHGVGGPLHAIELSSGYFAVSHLRPAHGVSIVSRGGGVVYSHRNDSSNNPQLLNNPRYLAVTANGYILIADKNNNRILVLNSTLNCARDLSLPIDGGLSRPQSLYLDESRGRLYVGEYGGKRTLVFDNVVNIKA